MTEVDAQSPHEPGDVGRPVVAGPLFDGVDLEVADDSDDAQFGYPQDEDAEATPPRRRHIGRYVAGAVALGVVAVGVVTGPTLSHVYAARGTSLSWPAEVAGLTRDTSADSTATADYLRDAVSSGTSLAHPSSAVYDIGGDKAHSVLLFGGTGSIYRPDQQLSRVLGLLDDSQDGSVTGLHEVSPGPLGGVMKCGTSVGSGDATDPDIPICGWADHGSAVAALFPGRTPEQAVDLFRQFRAAVEKR